MNPKQTNTPANRKICRSLTVDPDVWQKAIAKSKKTGVKISFVLQKALEEWITADESKK